MEQVELSYNILLVGMKNGSMTSENSLDFFFKEINMQLPYGPAFRFLSIYQNEIKTCVHTQKNSM